MQQNKQSPFKAQSESCWQNENLYVTNELASFKLCGEVMFCTGATKSTGLLGTSREFGAGLSFIFASQDIWPPGISRKLLVVLLATEATSNFLLLEPFKRGGDHLFAAVASSRDKWWITDNAKWSVLLLHFKRCGEDLFGVVATLNSLLVALFRISGGALSASNV